MRLATIEIRTHLGRHQRLGAVLDDGIVDLNFATAARLLTEGCAAPQRLADALAPAGMLAFIEAGDRALDEARLTLEHWRRTQPDHGPNLDRGPNDETLFYSTGEARLLTPLPNPRSIRDFYAFEAHVQRGFAKRGEPMPREWYEMPVYYKTAHHNLLGADADVHWPSFTRKFDYELELAAVVGRHGRNLKAGEALGHVFGYTIMNDFSARDVQRREMKVRLGPAKGKDWATAIGPWIVTADEIPDPYGLAMTARVNGAVWSSGNSRDMHWTFGQMLELLTEDDFVEPGDIIASGTVGGGCGLEIDRWIARGDVMELEVERIGVLRNRVV